MQKGTFMKIWHIAAAPIICGMLSACSGGTPQQTQNQQTQNQTQNQPEQTAKPKTESQTPTIKEPNPNWPTYRVATVNTYPPFATRDEIGLITGFDIDVIKLIAAKQSFNVEFVVHDWDDWESDLTNNEVDIWAAGITIKEKRKKIATYSNPYMSYRTALLTRDDETSAAINESTLANYKIGAENNSTSLEIAQSLNPNPDMVMGFRSNYLALTQLQQKGIDAVIGNNIVLANLTTSFPEYSYSLKPLSDEITQEKSLGFMVKKGRVDLATELNDGIDKIKVSGDFEKIHQKWFGYLVK